MSWSLKGRSAVASLDPATRQRVGCSQMMTRCANKPLMWVLEQLITSVDAVAGLSGRTRRVEYFLCLVFRLLQICPSPSVVLAMLRQDIHKYMRAAALFVIRLIGSASMMREAIQIGWSDYRKVRLYSSPSDDKDDMEMYRMHGVSRGGSSEEGDTHPSSTKLYNGISDSVAILTTTTSGESVIGAHRTDKVALKRTRQTMEEAVISAQAELAQLEHSSPPKYHITHMDELTDRLFDVVLTCGTATGKTNISNSERISHGRAHSFLGIPLTAVIW